MKVALHMNSMKWIESQQRRALKYTSYGTMDILRLALGQGLFLLKYIGSHWCSKCDLQCELFLSPSTCVIFEVF